MNLYDVLKKPVVSEKAESLRNSQCYVFEVDQAANKKLVSQAVKKVFGITPVKVNILNARADEKKNRYNSGYTAKRKKAYIYLAKNDKIEIFEGV